MRANFRPVLMARSGLGSAALIAMLLSGCATLPTNGPTGAQIRRDAAGPDNVLGYKIVDIDAQTIQAATADETGMAALATLRADGPVDTVGPGDVLSIDIYEVGSGLFNNNRTSLGGGDTGDVLGSSASSQSLGSGVTVDRDGAISVPYVGRLVVAGLTPAEVQDKILVGLRGKSQSPQVIVALRKNVANAVMIMGAVQKPGRLSLDLARDHLLDAIAESGGISLNVVSGSSTATGTGPQDMVVRFTRKDRTIEQRLDLIKSGSPDDLLLLPGDRIEVVRQPRTFTVFGALDKIAQMPFESQRLSLAEALARAGGPSDARADPRAIYVFRLAPAPTANGGSAPTGTGAEIYRLNMMHASGYILAQQFTMRDKDLIYISNASSNAPTKLVSIINQLFSPVFSIRAATN